MFFFERKHAFGVSESYSSIDFIFHVSACLPLLGIIAVFFPNTQKVRK